MPGLERKSSSVLSRKGSVTKQTSLRKATSSASTMSAASLQRATSRASTSGLVRKSTSKIGASIEDVAKSLKNQPSTTSQNGAKGVENVNGRGKKRAKFSTKFFEPVQVSKKPRLEKKERNLMFRSGEYLALRDENDGFYLCQTLQHIYDDMDQFKMMWLELVDEDGGVYERSYTCNQSYDCIVTHVKLKSLGKKDSKHQYQLVAMQKAKVLKALIRVLRREKGEPESSEEELEEEEKPKKKARAKKSASRKATSKPKPKKTPTKKEKVKKEKKGKKDQGDKSKKEAWTAEQRKNPNLRLKPNKFVTQWTKDPLLESRDTSPFVSTIVHSKLLHRAVMLNDLKLLKQLIDDNKKVSMVNLVHSVGLYQDPLHLALSRKNSKAVEMLAKEILNRDPKKKPRVAPAQSLLAKLGTGKYNVRSLGVPVIRAVALSRGSREGNNAFTKDDAHINTYPDIRKYVGFAMRKGVEKKILDQLLAAANQSTNKHTLYDQIWIAVRYGHRKLAGALMEEQTKAGGGMGFGFGGTNWNQLHKDVLLLDNEDLKANFRAASVRKKPWDNQGITPIHCAAINPNVKYLARLMSVLPEFSIMDKQNRRPIHYAVACEGTGPLEFLMKRGQDPNEADNTGMTALHIACEVGRAVNVEYLLNKAKQDAKEYEEAQAKAAAGTSDDADEDMPDNAVNAKYGVGGINRPVVKPQNRYYHGYTPLHIATEKGHIEVVKVLLKYGANVEVELGATKNKLTPLMKSAACGDLTSVKLLYSHKAIIEHKDKLKRTALTHAVMSGHANVVSYLLSLGANPDQADTSGNTCVHYAAGYGWYFCLKVLLQAGAHANTPNDWKMTPLGVCYLKGHMGLVEILLRQSGVDINFRDDKGLTLVAIAAASPLEEGLYEQIDYLINQKGANATIADVSGNTPLHHIANNNIKMGGSRWNQMLCPKAQDLSLKIAELLIEKGCDPSSKNEEGETPIIHAVGQGNNALVGLLVSKGAGVAEVCNKQGENILHLLASQCMYGNTVHLLRTIRKSLKKEEVKKLITGVDHKGFTPLLTAVKAYSTWNGKPGDAPGEEGDSESEVSENEEGSECAEEGSEGKDEEDTGNVEDEEMEDEDDGEQGEEEESMKDSEEEEIEKADEERETIVDPLAPVSEAETKILQQLEHGREFITELLDKFEAEVTDTVQKLHMTEEEKARKKEKEHYDSSYGKWNVVHFLIHVEHERAVKSANGASEPHPGLALMLSRKVDLEVRDLTGRTPLIRCILSAWTTAAKALINAGADITAASEDKDDLLSPPIVLAAQHNCRAIVDELLAKKVDVNVADHHKKTPVHYAAVLSAGEKAITGMLRDLLKAGGDVNARDRDQRTPLHLVVNTNSGLADSSAEVEQYLIEEGAEVFAQDKHNRFPLHYAFVKIGKHKDSSSIDPIELCNTLVGAMGGRLNIKDCFEQTALHCAAVRGAGVCSMFLIQKGANQHLTDKDGNTPLALAILKAHESCTTILMQKEGDINVNILIAGTTPPDPQTETEIPEVYNEPTKRRHRKPKPAWAWLTITKKTEGSEKLEYSVSQV